MVRRELSDNYCFYVPNYDTIDACYDWAKESLNKHRNDPREHVYTLCVHAALAVGFHFQLLEKLCTDIMP